MTRFSNGVALTMLNETTARNYRNAEVLQDIENAMPIGKTMTISQIKEAIHNNKPGGWEYWGYSIQKISAYVRKMCMAGLVRRTEVPAPTLTHPTAYKALFTRIH